MSKSTKQGKASGRIRRQVLRSDRFIAVALITSLYRRIESLAAYPAADDFQQCLADKAQEFADLFNWLGNVYWTDEAYHALWFRVFRLLNLSTAGMENPPTMLIAEGYDFGLDQDWAHVVDCFLLLYDVFDEVKRECPDVTAAAVAGQITTLFERLVKDMNDGVFVAKATESNDILLTALHIVEELASHC
jgi:glutathionyl-hydroquinone reductase